MSTLTVHMIGNAHLDPVWLWPWQRGADEAVATCRSACDILDDYPDVVFTRGEAWVHEQVRLLDPALFDRIRAHVKTGRWAVVNGWWVQPDLNLPTGEALLATARLGQTWFREHLGISDIPVAYNVDSFGHGAFLPRIIRQAGQHYYVMMRPTGNEKSLPANLFRWRSPDGHEVLTARIDNYLCPTPDRDALKNHIQSTIQTPRPAGIHHVMCFYGVGNHGGGPTRKLVNWILAHREFAPDVRLEFSSPQRFFAAVAADAHLAPVVEGELQHHAIGCYSVCGALKREIRTAELTAIDAGRLIAQYPPADPATAHRTLDAAWETICFNQFHDILPGSATAEAIHMARQEIGGAQSRLDRLVYMTLRRDTGVRERPVKGHRLHVVNRSPLSWSGLADIEEAVGFQQHLLDEKGQVIPHQFIMPTSLIAESFCPPVPRALFPITLQPGESRTLTIVQGPVSPDEMAGAAPRLEQGILDNGLIRVEFGQEGVTQVTFKGQALLARPLSLVALADGSDTWSHGLDLYHGPVHALGVFGAPVVTESGLLRTSVRLEGLIGRSPARLIVSLDRIASQVDLQLNINYQEPLTVLKASLAPRGGLTQRHDRVSGGWVSRPVDGREYPVHHALRLNDTALALVFPDSFAADCSSTGAARITLLRNNVHAYHSCSRLPQEDLPALRDRFGTDEGPQSLRLSLVCEATEAAAEAALARFQRPPFVWDDYHGVSRVQGYE